MLKQSKENDFYILKQTATGRLSPNQMTGFFWGAFVFSAIMIAVSYNAALSNNVSTTWTIFIQVYVVILAIQFLFTLFYSNTKNAYMFQKLQVYLLCIVLFKISIEMYLIYFLSIDDRNAPYYMVTIGVLMLIGGILYLIISTYRGINRVKKGEFKNGGKGLYNFQQSKGYISLPIIYGVSVIGGMLARSLSGTNGAFQIIEVLLPLLIAVFLQYSIAMIWPEFFLLAYCKKRFTSFNHIPNRYQ